MGSPRLDFHQGFVCENLNPTLRLSQLASGGPHQRLSQRPVHAALIRHHRIPAPPPWQAVLGHLPQGPSQANQQPRFASTTQLPRGCLASAPSGLGAEILREVSGQVCPGVFVADAEPVERRQSQEFQLSQLPCLPFLDLRPDLHAHLLS